MRTDPKVQLAQFTYTGECPAFLPKWYKEIWPKKISEVQNKDLMASLKLAFLTETYVLISPCRHVS